MYFKNYFQETNLQNLFHSAVKAFPKTTRRQHAIDEIRIAHINWTPFLGVKTLFVKGLAQNMENHHEYNPMILFKNVSYQQKKENHVQIQANDGKKYIFEKLKDNDVLVRCNCEDFKWRFNFTDYEDESLYGKVRKKYEAKYSPGSSNPLEMPGMCKHVMKLMKALTSAGVLED